jgi:hypothetical protein
VAEEGLERGVANPNVIDLITPDSDSGQVVLVMLEERAWSDEYARLKQLEDKINAYLVFVLDGFLHEQYPEYEGRAVRIQLDCAAEPPAGSRAAAMLTAARNYAAANDLHFAVNVKQG